MNSLFVSERDSRILPVWSEKTWKSITAPGSVAIILSTCPEAMSARDFFERRIGSGQFRPRTSSSLSKFMLLFLKRPILIIKRL